jgi:hypothetical protein
MTTDREIARAFLSLPSLHADPAAVAHAKESMRAYDEDKAWERATGPSLAHHSYNHQKERLRRVGVKHRPGTSRVRRIAGGKTTQKSTALPYGHWITLGGAHIFIKDEAS